jgi:hypothetical protein
MAVSLERALPSPSTLTEAQSALWGRLRQRLLVLNERAWENKISGPAIANWLSNFSGRSGASEDLERLHALFLLSQFTYFGSREIRVLLTALYRDLFLLPLIESVRESSGLSGLSLAQRLQEELNATRFLGVGNPSESGVHLLYYFRQENGLSKSSFLDSSELFDRTVAADGSVSRGLANKNITRYVFIDDICASGETVEKYAKNLLPDMTLPSREVELVYLAIFATSTGLTRVRQTAFGNNVGAVFELDDSYQYCGTKSRYLASCSPPELDASLLIRLCGVYGELLWAGNGLGFDNSQLLIGFSHNTPDNTLPIIWNDPENGAPFPWYPIFRRHPKI